MADAINAKSDVLGERELDAVSGGMSGLPGLVALVIAIIKGTDGGTSGGGGGPNDPMQQLFKQLLQAPGTP